MAQTTVSGRLFENDLRQMVSTLVWHNKYLGDKHDREDKYVDSVEVDTYLTGARHLLMFYSQSQLEDVENMDETQYMTYRKNASINEHIMYWDMFYYGAKVEYTRKSDGTYDVNDRQVEGSVQYVEKNTYYRELYGLPEFNGYDCYCNFCGYETATMGECPKCGKTGKDPATNKPYINYSHQAPSAYSWVAQFPRDYTKEYYVTDKHGNPVSPYDPLYNPLVFLYEQPLKTRLYADNSCSFVDDIIEKTGRDPHYKYLKHLTYAKIHPFVSRLSDRFEILYIADSDISFMKKDFLDVYNQCRTFMRYRYYTEAFRNQYEFYEGFIGMATLFMALQRMQSKYLEADITRDFYDLESIEVVYNAYSVPFYSEIPLMYHNKIIKAINKLISEKGTNNCFRDIFAIFGYSTLNMYQYYILKTQKRNGDGKFVFAYDSAGNLDPKKMYDVRIVKADIGENPYTYILDSLNYMDYYGVTDPDTYWINDDDLLNKLYHSEYNFLETKYIGIEMAFSLTRFTIETEYLMRMLLDNKNSGGNGTNNIYVYHGRIGKDLSVYTLVIYIMYNIGVELGLVGGGSLAPLKDPAKLSAIYGFNFLEDFSSVFGYLARKFVYNYKSGYIVSHSAGYRLDTDDEPTAIPDGMARIYTRTYAYATIDDAVAKNERKAVETFSPGDYILNDQVLHNNVSVINISKTVGSEGYWTLEQVPTEEDTDFFISTDYSTVDINNLDDDTKNNMRLEATLNRLDAANDNYAGFTTVIAPYIAAGVIMNEPNDVECKLVYAFNIVQKLLTTYTYKETMLRNMLDFKFVKVYYSADTCAFCGTPRTYNNQRIYCTNSWCFSHHTYVNGEGPLLINYKGQVPESSAIDTSKDTENVKYRNQVYADFNLNYSRVNTLVEPLITAFGVSIYRKINGVYEEYTPTQYFNEINEFEVFATNDSDNFIYVDPYILDSENADCRKSDLELTYYRFDAEYGYIRVTTTKIVYVEDTIYNRDGVDCVRVYVDDPIISSVNDKISIKYREVTMNYLDWNDTMVVGLQKRMDYEEAYDRYWEMTTHPSEYTPEEIESAREYMEYCRNIYSHTLYYLIGLINEYLNSETYVSLDVEWDSRTVQEILDSSEVDIYKTLIGLRAKREYRLYLSNQIEEISSQLFSESNPYYYSGTLYYIDCVRWVQFYLNYYFLDKKYTSSRLVDTVDRYFLFDHEHYVTDYRYGGNEKYQPLTSLTYMNDIVYSKRDGNKAVNAFTYISENIRDLLDENDPRGKHEHEIEIGVGRPVDSNWDKLKSSYETLADLYDAFTVLTWGVTDPRTFAAVRRLRKMLMTTKYAKEIYTLNGTNEVAETYGQLLDSIDPMLTARIDGMTEAQRIVELEYSLSCLEKISDDLIYIHAYGGFNMKKIISYIFKMILFFKSAKVDLLDYALEFRVDDKTDNIIKYMTTVTNISTNSTITPDHWNMHDYSAGHDLVTRLNFDKSIRLVFDDRCFHYGTTSRMLFSADLLEDQITGHSTSAVETTDLNNVLYDFMSDTERLTNVRDKFSFTEEFMLAKHKKYMIDYDAQPTFDRLGNPIYPFKLDENGNRIVEEYIDNT